MFDKMPLTVDLIVLCRWKRRPVHAEQSTHDLLVFVLWLCEKLKRGRRSTSVSRAPIAKTPLSKKKLTLLLGQLSAVHGNLVVSVCQVRGFDLVDEGADDQAAVMHEGQVEVSLALLLGF